MHGQEAKDVIMEQGEKMDTRTDQEIEDTARGQRTHAKLPPSQSATLTPLLECKQQLEEGRGCRILATAYGGGERGSAQSSANDTTDPRYQGEMCTVLWDMGAQISLMTHQYAREAGFKGRPASIRISGVGTGNKNRSRVQYRVLLKRWDGSLAEFTPYSVEKITGDSVRMDLGKAKALLPAVACKLESPDGPIPMLIGMDHMKNALREQRREDDVVLYQSEFNTGYTACGDMNQGNTGGMQKDRMPRVLSCRSSFFNPAEFIPAEAMGTELPRRCPACKNCKECQFRMDSLSFKENTKYEIILSKLKLDVDRRRWIAGYPFNTMVEHLMDNYNQARGFMG
jgi:hypothetical protein